MEKELEEAKQEIGRSDEMPFHQSTRKKLGDSRGLYKSTMVKVKVSRLI